LDSSLGRARSAAAMALLRSVSRPKLVNALRAYLLRQAGRAEADEALSLLGRWEKVLASADLRAALLAGVDVEPARKRGGHGREGGQGGGAGHEGR